LSSDGLDYLVPPRRLERLLLAPEASALSTELRGRSSLSDYAMAEPTDSRQSRCYSWLRPAPVLRIGLLSLRASRATWVIRWTVVIADVRASKLRTSGSTIS
jgi:hypothetical protein